jgi:hypothetical protein
VELSKRTKKENKEKGGKRSKNIKTFSPLAQTRKCAEYYYAMNNIPVK